MIILTNTASVTCQYFANIYHGVAITLEWRLMARYEFHVNAWLVRWLDKAHPRCVMIISTIQCAFAARYVSALILSSIGVVEWLWTRLIIASYMRYVFSTMIRRGCVFVYSRHRGFTMTSLCWRHSYLGRAFIIDSSCILSVIACVWFPRCMELQLHSGNRGVAISPMCL